MERNRVKRVFTILFVTHPIGYVSFLIFGIAAFIFVAIRVQIPIYKTVEAVVDIREEQMIVHTGEATPVEVVPIYIYKSREDSIEQICDYEIDIEKKIIKIPGSVFINCEKISVDVQVEKLSLLKYIFSTKAGQK